MNIGLIGLDTSHVNEFCTILNKQKKFNAKITHGFPGGSDLCAVSRDRVMKFTMSASQNGVEIVDEIEHVAEKCDALIITSCDGRQHLEQFEKIAPFKKPVFIDKPFTCSLADALSIQKLARQHGTPCFSASALRYAKGIHGFMKSKAINVAEIHGPVSILDDYPGWFWYGVHVIEIALEFLGTGVTELSATRNGNVDLVDATWDGGRKAILIGHRYENDHAWGARCWCEQGRFETIAATKPSFFDLMVPNIIEFFKSGVSPVDVQEMIDVVRIAEAVNTSIETCTSISLG
nr:Gfo/Idh/MocA family oxidoreductase [Candidatus Sigynarchaeota archaeon]